MEESGAMTAKKVWSIIRALYFMLGRNKSKKNYMQVLHLNMIMKHGKLARKAFRDLIFHHHKDVITTVDHHHHYSSDVLPGEYIYSCRDTRPLFSLTRNRFFSCAHAMPTKEDDEYCVSIGDMEALEMVESAVVSPAFGRSTGVVKMVEEPWCSPRQMHEEDSRVVDKAAEEFIIKFYKDLKKQNLVLFN